MWNYVIAGNSPNGTIPNPVNVYANEAINPTESTAENKDSFVKSESDNGKEIPSKECDLLQERFYVSLVK